MKAALEGAGGNTLDLGRGVFNNDAGSSWEMDFQEVQVPGASGRPCDIGNWDEGEGAPGGN